MKKFDEIRIKFIDSEKQRYDTAGDYYLRGKILHVLISKYTYLKNGKTVRNRLLEFLVLIHEMVEVLLVIARDISIYEIDEFDMNFKGDGQPGDEIDAPYRTEHRFATLIEKQMAKELGVDWNEYN